MPEVHGNPVVPYPSGLMAIGLISNTVFSQRDPSTAITFTPLPVPTDDELFAQTVAFGDNDDPLDPKQKAQVTFLDITFSDGRSATITYYPHTSTESVGMLGGIRPELPTTMAELTTVTIASTTFTETTTATVTPTDLNSPAPRSNTGLIAATSVVGFLFAVAFLSSLLLWRRVRTLEFEKANTTTVVSEPPVKVVYASEIMDGPRGPLVLDSAELSGENSEKMSNSV